MFWNPKCVRLVWLLIAAAFLPHSTRGQVPQVISYQGRILNNGTAFNGMGQFRFALVDATGANTFWSNDGTSVGGSQPGTALSVTVSNGFYSVLLGDTGANMLPIPYAVFANPDVRLRTWFSDGVQGVKLLTPDQRVAAVGYAIMAATASVANTVPDGSITSSKLAQGAVGAAQLADGAAAASLQANGQSPVASGGIILSTNGSATNLLNTGYVRIGTAAIGDVWEDQATGAPIQRAYHTAIWTGSEMIIWGGQNSNGVALADGARYNPVANIWTSISTTNAPSARFYHVGVWTGTQMLVWGGQNDSSSIFNNGAAYNPVLNTWTNLATSGAPNPRFSPSAVWTGTEMIVWGGIGGALSPLNSGARYNPANNTWTALPIPNPSTVRVYHSAIWTGSEMIIWGGRDGLNPMNTGIRYSPITNTWVATATTGAGLPSARFAHTAVWAGNQMIVWGGSTASGLANDGAIYNVAANSWTSINSSSAPFARYNHTAVWSGNEMLVWGGQTNTVRFNDGGRFSPVNNAWNPIPTTGAPAARIGHTALWTVGGMMIFGGQDGGTFFNDTGTFSPPRTMFLYLQP